MERESKTKSSGLKPHPQTPRWWPIHFSEVADPVVTHKKFFAIMGPSDKFSNVSIHNDFETQMINLANQNVTYSNLRTQQHE